MFETYATATVTIRTPGAQSGFDQAAPSDASVAAYVEHRTGLVVGPNGEQVTGERLIVWLKHKPLHTQNIIIDGTAYVIKSVATVEIWGIVDHYEAEVQ